MKNIIEKLRHIFEQAKKQGISLEALAPRLGVSVFTLSRWKRGKNRPSHLAEKTIDRIYREVTNDRESKE